MRPGLFFTFFLMISTALIAQERGTGFEMLNIAPSPYSLSKAEATVSIPNGTASIYTNPSLLALNPTSSLDLGYSFWIADISNIFGGANFKNNRQSIAFAFYTLGSDDYRQSDGPGPSNGTFSIQYLSVAGAYAYDFEYFALGAAFQYLNEDIYTYRASGYAFNAGVASDFLDGRIRTGASVSNLGEMEELDVEATTLPANFKLGASADLFEVSAQRNNDLPILLSVFADYTYPLAEKSENNYEDYSPADPFLGLGLSLTLADVLEVSGGYRTKDEARPFSFGASFIAENITFNYALVPFKTGRGTVHSVGLQYQF